MKHFLLRHLPVPFRAVLGVAFGSTQRESIHGRQSAFTLIELLTVVSIIAILLGMAGAAAYAARQAAYRSQAQAEVREIANACRAYWVASGSWKGGARWPGASGTIKHDGDLYRALTGDNPGQAVFLAFDEERFDGDEGEFLDPWGNPYEINFDKTTEISTKHFFSSSVTFPMRNRHEFYGHQFE